MPLVPSILRAAAEIRSGRLTPLQLVESCLERIRRFEPRVHAWVLVDEDAARDAARRLGDEIRQGHPRGPLHGIPVGIKDIIDVEGWPTLAGSTLRQGHRAKRDAPLVARLRAAGAVILGKTVTTEFAGFDPSPTRNPWDLARTPGGSSSGSAVAVALGMCLAAIGSQTGGSITRPASYCGVAGCKPTLGRISTTGFVPFSFHLDHPGPLGRTVGDLAAVLDAIAGYDPLDPVSLEGTLPGTCVAECRRPLRPRLGLVETFFMEEASPPIREATAAAVESLRAAGGEIAPAPLPASFGDVHQMHRRIMAVEAAGHHRPLFPAHRARYGREISKLLDEGLATAAVDYAAALAHRLQFRRDMLSAFQDFDALVTPATDVTAPGAETTGNPRFNSPWSYSGLPTVSLPCGLTRQRMPAAVQLIGKPFSEPSLLGIADWCERQWNFAAVGLLANEAWTSSAGAYEQGES